jgi:hypothetical protein
MMMLDCWTTSRPFSTATQSIMLLSFNMLEAHVVRTENGMADPVQGSDNVQFLLKLGEADDLSLAQR